MVLAALLVLTFYILETAQTFVIILDLFMAQSLNVYTLVVCIVRIH